MGMTGHRCTLVSVEGIDGAGKTTHAKLLERDLESESCHTKYMHFPDYSTETGKILAKVMRDEYKLSADALLGLFSVNRLECKSQVEEAATLFDAIVFDRYCESELAYGLAYDLPLNWLVSLESQMPVADLVIVLDIDPRVGIQRAARRGRLDTFEKTEFLRKVRSNYLSLAASQAIPKQEWQLIDSSREIEIVQKEIFDHVSRYHANIRGTL